MTTDKQTSTQAILQNSILSILATLTILGGRPYFFRDSLSALYNLDLSVIDEVTIALLQHRGMMVSIIGVLLVPSMFDRRFGRIAIPLVIFSKATFVLRLMPYAADVGSVYFDIGAIILLSIVYVWRYLIGRKS